MYRVTEHECNIAAARNLPIVQHNHLIQKNRYMLYKGNKKKKNESLNLSAQKLFLYLVSQIKPDDTSFERMEVDTNKFYEVLGMEANIGDNHNRLKDSVDTLWEASFYILDGSGGEPAEVRILSAREYTRKKRDSGKIWVKLNDDLLPYLTRLIGNYTIYSIHNILKMKTKYGIMLYQLLRSYAYQGAHIKFEIEEIKAILDAAKYKNFADFKKRVLTPAIEDITKYSDIKVAVNYEKAGRKVTHIAFTICDLANPKTDEDREEAQDRYWNVEKEIERGLNKHG